MYFPRLYKQNIIFVLFDKNDFSQSWRNRLDIRLSANYTRKHNERIRLYTFTLLMIRIKYTHYQTKTSLRCTLCAYIVFKHPRGVDKFYRGRVTPLLLLSFNTWRPRQNGRHFPVDIFKRIFFKQNVWISIRISLKFIPEVRFSNILALIQIMAWLRPGDKSLSEPMMVSLLTHICATRLQWVNGATCL